jgi:hypothetical protein
MRLLAGQSNPSLRGSSRIGRYSDRKSKVRA